jgi:Ca2+/H+ antiporter
MDASTTLAVAAAAVTVATPIVGVIVYVSNLASRLQAHQELDEQVQDDLRKSQHEMREDLKYVRERIDRALERRPHV